MSFHHKLRSAWTSADSMLCVGLDPDPARFPDGVDRDARGILDFCRTVVDTTAHAVCAFKPQIAYFSALGAERELELLCAHVRSTAPEAVLILDAKRGDIGSTAERYAIEAFERYGADAVTVNPYLGTDSLEPFLTHRNKGTIVLCRTSNPGGADLQNLLVDGTPLYEHIARLAVDDWSNKGEVALVVGATVPDELRRVRAIVGDLPLLVPGIGAQGGDVAATVAAGTDSTGYGMMINSSRAVLYASSGSDWIDATRRAAETTRDEIRAAR
ncbi:MAG: orotidine-5'-phosphate decarboxylase [Actinomycetota bacterium]|nr:orotidine-5'-phosphate decarboxylase [Actinomycetota bacterium]MDA2972323.1 orotidine-5'-phosphate decarboxylase [Actinomycetota bacterium]MDA3001411.1 orotidine-5'-phosphate decarboxylase [Actinomycetota bacterium]